MRGYVLSTLLVLLGGGAGWGLVGDDAVAGQLGTDANWMNTPLHPRGIDGEVLSSAVYGGDLYICGTFAFIADREVDGLARWDGSAWQPVPGNEGGADFPVVQSRLALYDGRLAVIRETTVAGGAADRIDVRLWDGSSWDVLPAVYSVLANGALAPIVRAAVEESGRLSIGGWPLRADLGDGHPHGAIRWTGSQWEGLAGLVPVRDLRVLDGNLVAALNSYSSDSSRVATFDGVSWNTLGAQFASPRISSLEVYGSDLLAARTGDVLRWDGLAWSSLHTFSYGEINRMVANGTDLFVGTFDAGVYGWNGTGWDALGPAGIHLDDVNVFLGQPVAGGIAYEARWNGTSWDFLGDQSGEGPSGAITALRSYGGALVVAGSFDVPGSGSKVLATWDGASWGDLGSPSGNWIWGLGEYNGDLVTAGYTVPSTGEVWDWDGASWTLLGGTNGTGQVRALVVYGTDLIAVGEFSELGGVPANGVAAWDGAAWSAVGAGVDVTGYLEGAQSARVWNGLLVVGGNFTAAAGNSSIQYLASWNGHQWKDLEPNGNNPPVVTGPVTSLAAYGTDLVAAGSFSSGAERIESWDGQGWSSLGTGLDASPDAMVEYQGYLFVTSSALTDAGGEPVNRIAAWDGVTWSALGSGLTEATSTAVGLWGLAEHAGNLWVGGDFRKAGSIVSYHVASWTLLVSSVDGSGTRRPGALLGPVVPNPFSAAGRVVYHLEAAAPVQARVFDLRGRPVARILDGWQAAGDHVVEWNPRGSGNRPVGAGVYFLRVSIPGRTESRRVVYVP